jgi:hypothetical protein
MHLLGQRLKPFYLSTNKLSIKDSDSQLMSGSPVPYWTPKYPRNSLSLTLYVRDILVPDYENLRNVMDDPMPPISLTMDNCSSHSKPELLALYALDNIRVIELPPFQTLCATVLLRALRPITRQISKVRQEINDAAVQGKVLGIDRAWHGYTCTLTVSQILGRSGEQAPYL